MQQIWYIKILWTKHFIIRDCFCYLGDLISINKEIQKQKERKGKEGEREAGERERGGREWRKLKELLSLLATEGFPSTCNWSIGCVMFVSQHERQSTSELRKQLAIKGTGWCVTAEMAELMWTYHLDGQWITPVMVRVKIGVLVR